MSICRPNSIVITLSFFAFRFQSKKSVHQYVGICRSGVCTIDLYDEEAVVDPEVVFLKCNSDDKRTYMLDEKDVSLISVKQIVATLPQPNLIQQGSRAFYQFKRPIDTY